MISADKKWSDGFGDIFGFANGSFHVRTLSAHVIKKVDPPAQEEEEEQSRPKG